MNGRSDMTPEQLTAIRNRAAALDYMHYDKKERTLLNEAAEDRNTLLAELEATKVKLAEMTADRDGILFRLNQRIRAYEETYKEQRREIERLTQASGGTDHG
jgi:uncharacterized protein (DUF3084 family)